VQFRRLATLDNPDTSDTVDITFTVPDDVTYIAYLFSWLAYMSYEDSWFEGDEPNALEPREQASIWTDVMISETRT